MNHRSTIRLAAPAWLARGASFCLALLLALGAGAAAAQGNAIESITANQQGGNVVLHIAMREAPARAPIGFSITNPARIALDFGATANATGKQSQDVNLGDVRGLNLVQAGERTRLVLNLARPLNYATAIDGKSVMVTIEGSGAVAQAVNAAGQPMASAAPAPAPAARHILRDLDFRRGSNGEGRVVVDLPHGQVGVDVRQAGNQVIVDFLRTGLPEALRRRLDVSDFGTPVTRVSTATQGENVRMTIEAQGAWEQSVYQSDTQLIVDVRPVKEDPNRPGGGNATGYRGEKLSFNFQNVEVRAALQAIADISGLNIITSDSVTGNLTLRLRDVPWDQALDVVLQAKGLDMRKNGTVLWIAPKEELLTKEKLELEQRAQIADLEPLRSEIFQLNYQKVEAFRTVFGLDANGAATTGSDTGRNRVLSRRGSAIIDPRTNQLFVTDIASKIEDIRKLIQKTDVASKQVLIEARLVEANDGFSRNLGAKLGFADLRTLRGGDSGWQVKGNERVAIGGNLTGVGQVTGQTPDDGDGYTNTTMVNLPAAAIGGTPASSLAFSLFSSAANRFLNLELSALEADGKGKIISSPRVVTEDKQIAVIEQGIELPYQVATSSGATSITFKKANLRLEVTPQITPDGNVVLDVDVNKDSKGEETRAGPAINTQHVKTKVMVENGGTVVLGGIYQQTERNNENKVPLLGDVPVLGYLFKSTGRESTKTELLVFITPKIVTDAAAGR
ncbi:type IV pilus secretin PilQ family protein [Massilia sp. MS-15]|uniref:type IV pilus secretin PilQ family protein n=1 Tax=Massilia sp. MS-15 TaxID=2878200 RepID=UPI001CD4BA55|nr:type IV pilus secretin PilQ family protein [Massilia sp. MS-15]MCA1247428.1 type IV pilus secretin PilQ [Massilia sp. MS-15]